MPNNNLINEEHVPGNWEPVEATPIVPGQAPSSAPAAPVPHDMPQFFSGSMPRQLQLDTSFDGTATASPRIPKHSLMPFGNQASGFTNAAAQSTVVKTTPAPTPSVTLYYQQVSNAGSTQVQRNILNFIGFTVADDTSLGSTDVTGNVTLNAPSTLFTLATQTVLLTSPLVLTLATHTAGTFLAGPTSGAAAAPTFRNIVNGDLASNGVGTATQALFSTAGSGTQPVWADVWYQTVQQAGSSKTQRHKLNFLAPITAADNSGNDSTDVAVPVFGASGTSHSTGLVPDPGAVAGTTRFLREDATWANVTSGVAGAVLVDGTAVSSDKLSYVNGSATVTTIWTFTTNGTPTG